MKNIRAGIIGGAGYTGGETIRLLLNHPDVELSFVQSGSNAGNRLYDVHADLLGDTEMRFVAEGDLSVDILFLCVGHGDARKFIEGTDIPSGTRIIDLSQDFRLRDSSSAGDRKFVYGLTDMNHNKIADARNIANPGCFATALQLALLPLAASGKLNSEVHISATTGSTGAGQKPSATTHFSWRTDNVSVYKSFEHQHLLEINESLRSLQPDFSVPLNFIPYRGDFARGIFASLHLRTELGQEEVTGLYKDYYKDSPFTLVSDKGIYLKQVVNTNKCLLHIEKHGEFLQVTSAIDNLLKGASGQAVENMNIMFGLERTAGLKLKPSAF